MEDIFKHDNSYYTNDLFPINEYINQASTYVSKRLKISKEDAIKRVKDIIQNSNIVNPIVEFRYKQDNGDVVKKAAKLTDYISKSIAANEVIVPSFTTYYHPSKQKSLHAEFAGNNVNRRSKFKKEAFKFKQLGDNTKAGYNDTMQKTMKIFNNSLSGAYASKSTMLYNPSAHYTLTSITRCVSSIGNAVSESFLAGNKYLKNADTVYNYITTIISNIDKDTVLKTIDTYKLYTPTPNEVMDMILSSSKWYWHDEKIEEDILRYLEKLEPYELASVMYMNDFWNLKNYNDKLLRDMIGNISKKITSGTNDITYFTKLPEGYDILVKIICADELKGINFNLDELKDKPIYTTLASTAKNVMEEFDKYKLLFRTFYITKILPIDIANIKQLFRDVIVLSDTDSTCGAYDQWVEWFYGNSRFDNEAISVAAVVMTINGKLIEHALKVLSRNMNIAEDRVELLKMKNEFYWNIFVSTNVNKHYFAQTLIQEGNVFKEPELELKGVHLIASAGNQEIVKEIHDMIKDINTTITSGNKLSLRKYIDQVASLERKILQRIDAGDISIYKKDKIKEPAGYKLDKDKSPYINHILWKEVFASKYGYPGEPTYMVIKIPTILKSKKMIEQFIETIEDEDIKKNLKDFISKYVKDSFGTFRPPLSVVTNTGVPKEILNIIDKTRIVKDNLNAAYLVLESIGFYKKVDKLILEMGY